MEIMVSWLKEISQTPIFQIFPLFCVFFFFNLGAMKHSKILDGWGGRGKEKLIDISITDTLGKSILGKSRYRNRSSGNWFTYFYPCQSTPKRVLIYFQG